LCSELAKLGHAARPGATELFTLFRIWLRRQFSRLGCEASADALAMHLLARSQGVAALASAFHDETFIRQEVEQMHDWLKTCTKGAPRDQGDTARAGERTKQRGAGKPGVRKVRRRSDPGKNDS
jgi:hypothetical protein